MGKILAIAMIALAVLAMGVTAVTTFVVTAVPSVAACNPDIDPWCDPCIEDPESCGGG